MICPNHVQPTAIAATKRKRQEKKSCSFICYSSQRLIFSFHLISEASLVQGAHLLGVVDVVDDLLDNGSGVGGLDTLGVVGDHSAGRSTDNDGTLLTL